jgi:hypothetical protein
MLQQNFLIRIYKNIENGDAESEWSNEYSIRTDAATTVADPLLNDDVNNLVVFEKRMHTYPVIFKRAVISTEFEHDPDGDVPSKTVGLDGRGQLTDAAAAPGTVDLSHVLPLNFNGNGGRAARHSYRGALENTRTKLGLLGLSFVGGGKTNYVNAVNDMLLTPTGPRLAITNEKDGNIYTRPVVSITVAEPSSRKRTARRKPKISQDEDAMMTRLRNAIKEVSLINASFAVRRATTGFDVTKTAELTLLITQVKETTQSLALE